MSIYRRYVDYGLSRARMAVKHGKDVAASLSFGRYDVPATEWVQGHILVDTQTNTIWVISIADRQMKK